MSHFKIRTTVAQIGKSYARSEPLLTERMLRSLFQNMVLPGANQCFDSDGNNVGTVNRILYTCSKPNLKKDRITMEITANSVHFSKHDLEQFIGKMKRHEIVFRVRHESTVDRRGNKIVRYRGVFFYPVSEDPYLQRWNRKKIWKWKNIKKALSFKNLCRMWNLSRPRFRNP